MDVQPGLSTIPRKWNASYLRPDNQRTIDYLLILTHIGQQVKLHHLLEEKLIRFHNSAHMEVFTGSYTLAGPNLQYRE